MAEEQNVVTAEQTTKKMKNGEIKLISQLTADQKEQMLLTIPVTGEARVIACKKVKDGYQLILEGGKTLFSETEAKRGDIAILGEARRGDIVKVSATEAMVYELNVTRLVTVAAAGSEELMAQAMKQYGVQFAVAKTKVEA